VILGVIAFLFGVDLLWRAMSGKVHAPYVLMAWHFAVLAVLCAFIVFPAINPYKSVREFCMPVRNLAQADADVTVYSIGFSREEYVFYSGRFHTPLMTGNSALEVFGGEATAEQTAALRRLRKTMAKAAMGVAVADNTAITRDEVSALTDAVGAAVASLEISDALVREAEAAFEGTVAALDDRLAGPGACFAFVQVPDWRCLLATRPALGRFTVVREDGVGHRDVLLIANDLAWRMMTGSS